MSSPGYCSPDTLPPVRSSLSPGGSGAAAPGGALRALNSSVRPRRWRAFGRRRLRRRSPPDPLDSHSDSAWPKLLSLVARGPGGLTPALKASIGCADVLDADSFRLSMTLDRMEWDERDPG